MRIIPNSPLAPAARGAPLTLWIDGRPVTAFAGETLAAVLFVEGRRVIYRPAVDGTSTRPRGVYCGMGICFECLVWVETPVGTGDDSHLRAVRACLTPVESGMRIHTSRPNPSQPRSND
ncbi:MAG: (2Fe-2S)-binding protein [Anaerolineae bacterium]|nr:(2Fe-2S)-binding protein [Thermoflexales bacterium]MDW8408385.1 (2Fe-2S)-binding protein [Anaerolineae bacterium]